MSEKNNQLQRITKVLNGLNLNEMGKTTGFCARQRVIKPFELIVSLVTAMGEKPVNTLSELHRYFVGLTKTDVQYKPFHNQLSKPAFADLMKQVVGSAMVQWQQQILGKSVELAAFDGIILQDGSSFAVHDALKDTFKGRFTTISPAAVEIHVAWDVLQSYPEQIAITPDSEAEYHHLPSPESLKNKLLLADRGYFKLPYIEQVREAGGHCLIRAKATANPLVLKGCNSKGKMLKRFKNRKFKEVKKYIRRGQVVDMDVQGKNPYRLIASWPPGKDEPTLWATTLPRESYPANAILKLYRLRWQIELLFKEWKSYCSLGKFNTRKGTMVEGLIWTSLLALMLKRRIGSSVAGLTQADLSSFVVAKSTQGWFYDLMASVLSGSKVKLKKVWNWTIKYLSAYAKRANPDRDGKTGRLQYGIQSIFP